MPLPPKQPGPDDPPAKHLGWALRARREALALDRAAVGAALGYSEERVKQVELAIYPAGTAFMARWREIYGIDDELRVLWERTLADSTPRPRRKRASEPDSGRQLGSEWSPASTTHLLEPLDDQAGMSAATAARLAHEWLITDPPHVVELAAGRRIGADLVATIERRVVQLRRMDDFIGGGDLLAVIRAELAHTKQLLNEAAYDEYLGRRLLSSVADLLHLGGWAAADGGQRELAEQLYTRGIHAAHAADDAPMAANLISSLSYLYTNKGEVREGVVLARTAAAGARHRASATTQALLEERVAWSHAKAGELRETEHALGAVDDLFEQRQPEDDPPFVYWLDRDEVEVMAGRCYTELRRPERAEPRLRAVLHRYDDDRAREKALYGSWLAEDYIQVGEIDQAATQATEALRLSAKVNSARGRERVSVVRRKLHPYRSNKAVQAFEAAYQELTA